MAQQLGSLAVGDLDGDGHAEVVTGGEGALLWYRPDALERGVIAEGHFHVGLALEDLDGDGIQVFELAPGRLGIISHGWMDVKYVRLWGA